MLNNTDSSGHDLQQYANLSVNDCKSRCDASNDCAGFGYDNIARYRTTCYLKDYSMYPFGNKQPLNSFDLYTKQSTTFDGLNYSVYKDNTQFGQWVDGLKKNLSIFNGTPIRNGKIDCKSMYTVNDVSSLDRLFGVNLSNSNSDQFFAVKLKGYFTPNISGKWKFLFMDRLRTNWTMDDIFYLWFDNEPNVSTVSNPTEDNKKIYVDFTTARGIDYNTIPGKIQYEKTYITFDLTAGTSYPLLMYWGQIFGGWVFCFGIIPPNANGEAGPDSNLTYDGSKYFSTRPIKTLMNSNQLQCYKDNYPDLSALNSEQLQNHWDTIGKSENRNNDCPGAQTISGNYAYAGCYNNPDPDHMAVPNFRQNVSSIDECSSIADRNNESIFALRFNGQCWTGTDKDRAKSFGPNFDKNSCNWKNGAEWTVPLYIRNKPFPPPEPPVPQLTNYNFNPTGPEPVIPPPVPPVVPPDMVSNDYTSGALPVYVACKFGEGPWGTTWGNGQTFITRDNNGFIKVDTADFNDNTASWIWYTPDAHMNAPVNTVPVSIQYLYYNRSGYNIKATLYVIIDNVGDILLNGVILTNSSSSGKKINITIPTGKNLFEFKVINQGGPAGLVVAVYYQNTRNLLFHTDSTWKFVKQPDLVNFSYSANALPVYVAIPYGGSPWGTGWKNNIGLNDSSANWIWYTPNAQNNAPVNPNPVIFQYIYSNNTGSNISATLYCIPDDWTSFSLNNRLIVSNTSNAIRVNLLILPGNNLFEFNAINGGGPAGLVVTVYDSNSRLLFHTDSSWKYILSREQYANSCNSNINGGLCNNEMNSNRCRVNMQPDGNLVVYNTNGAVWASGTDNKGWPSYRAPYRLIMQTDGNLVAYDSTNRAVWASGTNGRGPGPYSAIMQDDCNFVVYNSDPNNSAKWASNTAGR